MSLTSPKVQRGGGFEKGVYHVPATGVVGAAERGTLDQALCGWYTSAPRPDPRDVVRKEMRPVADSSHVEVSLTLRRGHYLLARLAAAHESITRHASGKVTCTCHPDAEWWVLKDTLPDYYEER